MSDRLGPRAHDAHTTEPLRTPFDAGVPQTSVVIRQFTEPAKGEVDELLRAWRAGEKVPAAVPHNPVPADAPEPVRRVAEFVLALVGLLRAELIDAPFMLAKDWLAGQPEMEGLSNTTVWRAMLKLRGDDSHGEYGFIYKAGERAPRKPHLKPVFLYELCPVPAVAVERAAGVVRQADEPEVELVGEPPVVTAEGAARGPLAVAPGDGAVHRVGRVEAATHGFDVVHASEFGARPGDAGRSR